MSKDRRLAGRWALVALISLAFVGRALAADAVLESSALRLEVSAAPYAYSVIEKATRIFREVVTA